MLLAAYEQLRRVVMRAGVRAARGHGVGILIGRGMPAWMRAYQAHGVHIRSPQARRQPPTTPLLGDEVVHILTTMALSTITQPQVSTGTSP